jgi:hypothetical protein
MKKSRFAEEQMVAMLRDAPQRVASNSSSAKSTGRLNRAGASRRRQFRSLSL